MGTDRQVILILGFLLIGFIFLFVKASSGELVKEYDYIHGNVDIFGESTLDVIEKKLNESEKRNNATIKVHILEKEFQNFAEFENEGRMLFLDEYDLKNQGKPLFNVLVVYGKIKNENHIGYFHSYECSILTKRMQNLSSTTLIGEISDEVLLNKINDVIDNVQYSLDISGEECLLHVCELIRAGKDSRERLDMFKDSADGINPCEEPIRDENGKISKEAHKCARGHDVIYCLYQAAFQPEEIKNILENFIVNDKVFIVDDRNWRDVLSLFPIAVYHTVPSDSVNEKEIRKQTIEYSPWIVYHKENIGQGDAIDVESIIIYLRQLISIKERRPKEIIIYSNEEDLKDIKIALMDKEIGLGRLIEKYGIRVSYLPPTIDNYHRIWNSKNKASYKNIVVAEHDNYKLGLLAAHLASFMNAPLLFSDNPDTLKSFKKREIENIYLIGELSEGLSKEAHEILKDNTNENSKHPEELRTVKALQNKLIDLINPDGIILVNPEDIYPDYCLDHDIFSSFGKIEKSYCSDSINSPLLASAKNELIVFGNPEPVNFELTKDIPSCKKFGLGRTDTPRPISYQVDRQGVLYAGTPSLIYTANLEKRNLLPYFHPSGYDGKKLVFKELIRSPDGGLILALYQSENENINMFTYLMYDLKTDFVIKDNNQYGRWAKSPSFIINSGYRLESFSVSDDRKIKSVYLDENDDVILSKGILKGNTEITETELIKLFAIKDLQNIEKYEKSLIKDIRLLSYPEGTYIAIYFSDGKMIIYRYDDDEESGIFIQELNKEDSNSGKIIIIEDTYENIIPDSKGTLYLYNRLFYHSIKYIPSDLSKIKEKIFGDDISDTEFYYHFLLFMDDGEERLILGLEDSIFLITDAKDIIDILNKEDCIDGYYSNIKSKKNIRRKLESELKSKADDIIEELKTYLVLPSVKYLTIIASPNSIPLPDEDDYYLKKSVDYPKNGIPVGRIFGITNSDSSSYINRVLSFNNGILARFPHNGELKIANTFSILNDYTTSVIKTDNQIKVLINDLMKEKEYDVDCFERMSNIGDACTQIDSIKPLHPNLFDRDIVIYSDTIVEPHGFIPARVDHKELPELESSIWMVNFDESNMNFYTSMKNAFIPANHIRKGGLGFCLIKESVVFNRYKGLYSFSRKVVEEEYDLGNAIKSSAIDVRGKYNLFGDPSVNPEFIKKRSKKKLVQPIEKCTTITEPGIYILAGDITAKKNNDCIIIDSENVILDCDNHRITGPTMLHMSNPIMSGSLAKGYNGIEVKKDNAIIKNCIISGFQACGIFLNSDSNELLNNKISLNVDGIVCEFCKKNSIKGNNEIFQNVRYGILLDSIAIDNIILDNDIHDNFDGLVMGGTITKTITGNTIKQNTIHTNMGTGLYLQAQGANPKNHNNRISKNIFYDNMDDIDSDKKSSNNFGCGNIDNKKKNIQSYTGNNNCINKMSDAKCTKPC